MRNKIERIEKMLNVNCNWFNIDTDEIVDIFYDEDIERYIVTFESCCVTEENYREYLKETPKYFLDRSDYFASETNTYTYTISQKLTDSIKQILGD